MKTAGFRSSFGKEGKRRKAAMHLIPNLFTTGNLFCGVFAILSVFNANYVEAAIAILVAMIFDVLDGKSARLTNSTSQFGLEYDSLSDVVSFGVAPGLLIYSWALSGQGTFGVAVMFAYVAMGAVRLARFNSTVALSATLSAVIHPLWNRRSKFRRQPRQWRREKPISPCGSMKVLPRSFRELNRGRRTVLHPEDRWGPPRVPFGRSALRISDRSAP